MSISNMSALGTDGEENASSTLLGSVIGNLPVKLTKADNHEKKKKKHLNSFPGMMYTCESWTVNKAEH